MRWVVLIAVVLAVAATSTAAAPRGQQSLLTVGTFHGDEIRAESGEVWVGLFRSEAESYLRRTRILVSTVYDPIIDESEEHPTGKQVSTGGTDGTGQALFLFPLRLSLRDGPVVVAQSERESLDFHAPMSLALGRETYGLELILESTNAPDLGCRIVLRRGSQSQILERSERCDPDKWPSLLWAGDLDRDGKLDLIIDQADHYNVTALALYLSSKARDGALVARAGYLRVVGC